MSTSTTKPKRSKRERLLRFFGRKKTNRLTSTVEQGGQGLGQLHEVASLGWHGFKLFVETTERILDGSSQKIPVGVLSTFIGISNNIVKNKESTSDLLISIHKRFEVIAEDILQGGRYPEGTKSTCEKFAKILITEIFSLNNMQDDRIFRQVLETSGYPRGVETILKNIDEATKHFGLALTLANIRQIEAIRGNTEILRLNGLKQFIDVSYPQIRHESCAQGTRGDILDKALAWCSDLSPNSPAIFWLSGIAGTGKSTIAYTLCQQLCSAGDAVKVLGGSFFCSHQALNSRRHQGIIPTIAHQLAHSFPPYGQFLLEHKLDVSPPELAHVKEMLIEPWNESIQRCGKKVPNLVVVIDGLDEMDGNNGSEFLQDLIYTISEQKGHQGLKFFVTSQQDPHALKSWKSLQSEAIIHCQDVASDAVQEDIWKHLQKSLPNLDPSQLHQLAVQASGSFIYAATAVRIIDSPSHQAHHLKTQKDHLESLLKTKVFPKQSQHIDILYEEVLCDYINDMLDDRVDMSISVLETVICSQEPLSVPNICELSKQGKIDITKEVTFDLVRLLHAVLYVDAVSGYVYFYHKSFVDFMCHATCIKDQKLKKILGKFSVNKGHYHLTIKCFDVMKSLQFNLCNLPSSFLEDEQVRYWEDGQVKGLQTEIYRRISTVLQYACKFWAAHLKKIPQKTHKEDIQDIFIEWLDNRSVFWIEAMSLLKLIGECIPSLRDTRKWLGITGLNQINNVIAAEKLITIFGKNVTVNFTPHLYLSGLAILPGDSYFRNKWLSRFPGLPNVNAYLRNEGELMSIYLPDEVSSVAFSPDGSRIVSGSYDNSVRIWDASNGKQILVLNGHTDPVASVAFSPDGSKIISSSWDNSMRIWEASTGKQVLEL